MRLHGMAFWPRGWSFGGLVPHDAGKPTWLSVRALGQGAGTSHVRELVAQALGVPTLPAPAVTLQVRGAGVAELAALRGDADAAAQAAAEAVFGPGVALQGHVWLSRTLIARPSRDVRVAGLHASLPDGPFCGPGDSRDSSRSQTWTRVKWDHKRRPAERGGLRPFLDPVQGPQSTTGASGEDAAMLEEEEADDEDIL